MISRFPRFLLYLRISKVLSIAARYFVLNGFDGLYTLMGIIVGSYVAGHHDPSIVLGAGLAGILALGVSGSASAYLAEKAMRQKKLKDLEQSMLIKLDGTIQEDASRFAALFTSAVNGLSPVLTATIMIVPFMLAKKGLILVEMAFVYSLLLGAVEIFLIGTYLGKISNQSKLIYGLKMLFVGAIAVVVSYIAGYALS